PAQRDFLTRLAGVVAERDGWTGEALHERIHALKTEMGLPSKDAFAAIYLVFLGKPSGPQAGWFLASLDRAFVLARLREISGGVRE
ncbi:MAG TPA: lysine--tRNA ligase, partial [bacterium]|nr:lysine--tRNA ligase [bacterium]